MRRKLTTKEVLDRFKKVHGDKYDYSLVEYKEKDKKVIIVCPLPEHGDFPQTPASHLNGNGCPKCGIVKRSNSRRKTKEVFIKQAKEVHPDKNYGYEKIDYKHTNKKVIIVCPIHGDFPQTPASHLNGNGCPKCGIISIKEKQKFTQKEVLDRFKKVHGDTYDYSLVEYENQEKKIIIVCRVHGDFQQAPVMHWSGIGCPKCGIIKQSKSIRKTTEKFIEEAKLVHGDKYDYHKVDYKHGRKEVIIVCPVHGEFLQVPNNHVEGNGCYDCSLIVSAEKRKLGIEKFIERSNHIHNNFYQYEKVEYVNAFTKVVIVCPLHGDFPQVPDSHLSGRGCPKCYNKNEGRLAVMLNEIGVVHRQYKIENKRYDFYLPDYNILIERDGEQHYRGTDFGGTDKNENLNFQQNNDNSKTNLAKSKGHKICRIPYWLREEDERKEIQNILNGQPTYPDVPDLEHEKSKPLPN